MRRYKIAIDASTFSTQGGPRAYLIGLMDALFATDTENEYVIFYNDPSHLGRYPEKKEIVLEGKQPLARLYREHVLLPQACGRENVDLLHCPKSAIPFRSPCPVVVTLHDLIPILHPKTETFAARMYWRMQMPLAAKKSDHIITISKHAAHEIINHFDVPLDRISVVYNGFDPARFQTVTSDDIERCRKRYNLPDRFLLYVGTIQPRKNLSTLVDAYALLKKDGFNDVKLVIAGRKGWLYGDLMKKTEEMERDGSIVYTGFVDDKDLPSLYASADVFAYLSLFEGFGIPPLEAMASGVPVVASNATAIPEVVGKAALTVEPTDAPAAAAAIKSILSDNGLRYSLIAAGRERSTLFTWQKAAREVLEIYRQTIQGSK